MKAPNWIIKRTRLLNWFHYFNIFGAHSQMIGSEQLMLKNYAKNRLNALEVGTYMGVSANIIAASMSSEGILYCVDPFLDRDGHTNPGLLMAERDMKRKGVLHKIKFLKGLSTDDAIRRMIPSDLDFIFIDGDHSFEGIKNDWGIVREKLRIKGIVCLHDTIVPSEEPWRKFGSVLFFNEIIRNDFDFQLRDSCHSMTVLERTR